MLIRTILLALSVVGIAHAQDASLRYATMPDLATAQTLSAAAWAAMRCTPQPQCDVAQVTQYNYPIIGLTNGKYAIVIHSGDVYQGEHLVLANGKTYDLTANQIASLQTRTQIGVLLADVLPVALVGSRLSTLGKTNAVNTAVNADQTLKANYNTLVSGPIDLQGNLVWTVMAELVADGALTNSDVATLTAYQTVAVVN